MKNLLTEAEQIRIFQYRYLTIIKDLPKNTERCYVRCGGEIHGALREAKEFATKTNRPVSFNFNDVVVVVDKDSNVDSMFYQWWKDVYHETYEESARKR